MTPAPEIQNHRQCIELQYLLVGDLRELLDQSLDEQNHEWLRQTLDVLIDTLSREQDFKDEYSFEDVEVRPSQHHRQLKSLEVEQVLLRNALCQLRTALDERSLDGDIARMFERTLEDWMDCLKSYRRREERLTHRRFWQF